MKLSLRYFRGQKLPFNRNENLSVFTVNEIASGQVNLDWKVYLPTLGLDLQRGYVWTAEQKQQLILSVLKGIALPKVSLIQYREKSLQESTYQIIDGKQRLSTLSQFVNNIFCLEVEGQKVFYKDLPEDCQREISSLWIVADVGYEYKDAPIPDAEKVRWFNLINFAGTPQDQAHFDKLQNAVKTNEQ